MCNPDQKIKFCTCKLSDELPKAWWMLHRYSGKKDIIIMGDPVLPDRYSTDYSQINNGILECLNEEKCFDREITFKSKDVLVVCLSGPGQLFAFRYARKMWMEFNKYDPFELMNKYDEIRKGYVETSGNSIL